MPAKLVRRIVSILHVSSCSSHAASYEPHLTSRNLILPDLIIYLQLFEAHPSDLPGVTAFILSQLRQAHPLEPIASGEVDVQRNTVLLPQGLEEMILEMLVSLGSPPLQNMGILHPRTWLEILFKGFPWLWDLNRDECYAKEEETQEDGSKKVWDWEGLVRRLAQRDAFEARGNMQHAPLELRNRRRIWRCLDGMQKPPLATEDTA